MNEEHWNTLGIGTGVILMLLLAAASFLITAAGMGWAFNGWTLGPKTWGLIRLAVYFYGWAAVFYFLSALCFWRVDKKKEKNEMDRRRRRRRRRR